MVSLYGVLWKKVERCSGSDGRAWAARNASQFSDGKTESRKSSNEEKGEMAEEARA